MTPLLPTSGPGDHNYCRNPDRDPRGPWCYISSETGVPEKRPCEDVRCPGTRPGTPGRGRLPSPGRRAAQQWFHPPRTCGRSTPAPPRSTPAPSDWSELSPSRRAQSPLAAAAFGVSSSSASTCKQRWEAAWLVPQSAPPAFTVCSGCCEPGTMLTVPGKKLCEGSESPRSLTTCQRQWVCSDLNSKLLDSRKLKQFSRIK